LLIVLEPPPPPCGGICGAHEPGHLVHKGLGFKSRLGNQYPRVFVLGSNRRRSFSTVTGLRPDDRCSIPGRARKRFFYSPPRSDRLWGPSNLLSNGYRQLFPVVKQSVPIHLGRLVAGVPQPAEHHAKLQVTRRAAQWLVSVHICMCLSVRP
jgi:hypothetical protein